MDATQLLWVNFGVLGLIGAAGIVYLRQSLKASVARVEADAQAQIKRQGSEATFDKKLLEQLEERDSTLRDERDQHAKALAAERQQHAEALKEKNEELTDFKARNRELNDRFYEKMGQVLTLQAEASVMALRHNAEVVRAQEEARKEARDGIVRLHDKLDAEARAREISDKKLTACEEGHAQCSTRLEAIERLLHMRIAADDEAQRPPPADDGVVTERMR